MATEGLCFLIVGEYQFCDHILCRTVLQIALLLKLSQKEKENEKENKRKRNHTLLNYNCSTCLALRQSSKQPQVAEELSKL